MRTIVRFGACALALVLAGCGDTAKELEREAKDKVQDELETRGRAATDSVVKDLDKEAKALEGDGKQNP